MTLKVALQTPADVAKARRLVQAAAENELVRAQEHPASTGLFSLLPGTAWLGQCVANWGGHELRCMVEAAGDALRLSSRGAWTAEIYRCLRRIHVRRGPPTWNYFDSRLRSRWETPGGTGPADAVLLDRIEFSPGRPVAVLAIPKGTGALLIRRADEGAEAVGLVCEALKFHPRQPLGRNQP